MRLAASLSKLRNVLTELRSSVRRSRLASPPLPFHHHDPNSSPPALPSSSHIPQSQRQAFRPVFRFDARPLLRPSAGSYKGPSPPRPSHPPSPPQTTKSPSPSPSAIASPHNMARRQQQSHAGIPGLGLGGSTSAPQPPPQSNDDPQKAPTKKGKKSKKALRKQAEAEAHAKRRNPKAKAAEVVPPQAPPATAPPSALPAINPLATPFSPDVDTDTPSTSRDARQPPSKASGGIPDPSPLYIAQAHGPPSLLPQPRRILIVVDLNGTLLYRPSRRRPFHFLPRPHAQQFLAYCLDTYRVAIWSSARPDNVQKMVAQLLTPEQRARCTVIWARDRFGLSAEDYDSRVQCYKRLGKLWADPQVAASHPGFVHGGRWDQSNTVLIDDSLEKARTEPFNILEIPEFEGVVNETTNVLPQVHDYLNKLCWQTDISRFMRTQPFTLDATYKLLPEIGA